MGSVSEWHLALRVLEQRLWGPLGTASGIGRTCVGSGHFPQTQDCQDERCRRQRQATALHGRTRSTAGRASRPRETGHLGCVAVMFGRACWKEPPSLTAHRDPELKASPPMGKAFRSKGNCLSPDSNFCQRPVLACPPRSVLPNSSSPPRPAPRRPPLPSLLTPGRVFVLFPPSASPSPPQRAGQTGRGAGRWLRPTLPAFMLPVLQAARSFAL